MEMNYGMFSQPAIILRFMRVQVIKDDVQFFLRILRHDLIHEVQKLAATAAMIMSDFHHAGSHLKSSEESSSAMPLVLVIESPKSLSVREAKPTLGTLQCLNGRFLVHTDDNRILGRIQVQTNDVSGFLSELGVSTHAPTVASLQVNAMFPEYTPDLMRGDVSQLSSHQCSIPTGISRRWIGIQQGEYFPFRVLVVTGFLARTRRICQSFKTGCRKTLAPLYNHRPRQPYLLGYRFVLFALGGKQDKAGSLYRPIRRSSGPGYLFQFLSFFHGQFDIYFRFSHALIIT